MERVLEIGSGMHPYVGQPTEDVVHLDQFALPHVEQVWDLEQRPYPFPNDSFDRIVALDVLEHLSDVRGCLEELWRLGRAGARVTIRVPHWASFRAHRDPTHRSFFDEHSFDYFGSNDYSFYGPARFRVCSVVQELAYPRLDRLLSILVPRLARGVRKHLINMVLNLTFELEVVKATEVGQAH
ncbi:MAG: methyltransferase domain-containing protein [candidate division WOR-3 bacterium]